MPDTNLSTGGQSPNLFSGYNIDTEGSISQVQVKALTSDDVTTKDSTGKSVAPTATYNLNLTTFTGAVALTPPAAGGTSFSLTDIQQINKLINGPFGSTDQPETVTPPPEQGAQTRSPMEQKQQGEAESQYGDGFVSAAASNGVSLDEMDNTAAQVNTETNAQVNSYLSNPPGSNLSSDQKLQVILTVLAAGNPDIKSPQDSAVAAAVKDIQANLAANPNIPSWALNNLPSAQQIGVEQEIYGEDFTNTALTKGVSPDQIAVIAENVNKETMAQLTAFFDGTETPPMTPNGTALSPEEQVQLLYQVLVPDGDVAATLSPNVAAAVKNLRSLLANDSNIPAWLQTGSPGKSLMPRDGDSPTGQFMQQMADQNDALFEQSLAVATLNGQPLSKTQIAILQYAHYNPEHNDKLPSDMAAVLKSCHTQFQALYGFGDSYVAPTNFQQLNQTIDGAFATNLTLALAAVVPALTDQEIVDIAQYASNPSSAPAQYQTLLTNAVAAATAATKVEFPGLPTNWVPTVFPVLSVAGIETLKKTQGILNMLSEQADIAEKYINSMPAGDTQSSYMNYLKLVRGALSQAQSDQYIIEEEKSKATQRETNIQNAIQTFGIKVNNLIQDEIKKQWDKMHKPKPHGWLKHFVTAITCACILIAAAVATAALEVVSLGTATAAVALLDAFAVAYCVDAIQADARGTTSGITQGMTDLTVACEKAIPGEGGRIFATIMTAVVLAAVALVNPEVMATMLLTDSNFVSTFVSTLPLSPAQAAKAEMICTYVLLVATIGVSMGSALGKMTKAVATGVRDLSFAVGRSMGMSIQKSATELAREAASLTAASSKAEAAAAKATQAAEEGEKAAKEGFQKIDEGTPGAKEKDATIKTDMKTAESIGTDISAVQRRINSIASDSADQITLANQLNTLQKNLMKIRGEILNKITNSIAKTGDEVKAIKAAMGKIPDAGTLAKIQQDAVKAQQVAADLKVAAAQAQQLAKAAKEGGILSKGAKSVEDAGKYCKKNMMDFHASVATRFNKTALGRGINKVTSSKGWKAVTYNVTDHSAKMAKGSERLAGMLGLSKNALSFDEMMNKAFLLVGIATSAMEIQADKFDYDNAMIQKQIALLTEQMNIVKINVEADVTKFTSLIKNLQQGLADSGQTIVDIGAIMNAILKENQTMASKITGIHV